MERRVWGAGECPTEGEGRQTGEAALANPPAAPSSPSSSASLKKRKEMKNEKEMRNGRAQSFNRLPGGSGANPVPQSFSFNRGASLQRSSRL
jgi:hypothetical protein